MAPLILERANVRRGERLVDVGCGTGAVARAAAPLVGPAGRVVGLDPNPQMLEVARALPRADGAPVEWVEGDAAAPPPGPFDVITCQHALQFVPDRKAAVRAMKEALASGGRSAISVWRPLERQPVYAPLIEAEARHLGVPVEELAEPFQMGDPAELQDAVERELDPVLRRHVQDDAVVFQMHAQVALAMA